MLTIKDFEAKFDAATKDRKPIEVGAAMAAIVAREVVREIASLERRLGEIERKAMVFAGAFDIAKSYEPSDVVQRSSGLWIALVATKAGDVPGASSSWRRIAESKA